MKALVTLWRRSIRFRVVSSTIILTGLVIFVTGWALLHSVADGLAENRRELAIAEARVGLDQAQAQLDAATPTEPMAQATTLTQLVDTLAATRSENRRYELILQGPLTDPDQDVRVRTSGAVTASQLPGEMVDQVNESAGTYWSYAELRFLGHSDDVASVVVGRRLVVPNTSEYYALYYVFSMAEQQQTLALVTGAILGGGVGMVIMVGAVALLISRQVVDPLRRATQIAEKYSAGQLEKRMEVSGEDDIARLSLAFNQMAASIQSQIGRLENLSLLQQRFVSDVSHELRTPLTTIQMASGVLYEEKQHLEPHAARAAELLQAQLDRFGELLSDLLDLSRFDAGAAQLELDRVDLAEIADQATYDPVLEASGIFALARGNRKPAIVEADLRRVDRIVRNLLANAAKYSGSTKVEIVVAQNTESVSLAVRDFGVGMPPEQIEHVFDRFWRADPARQQGGTGLGLAIAREDAILHGGSIDVWSRPNLGTEFILTLPKPGQVISGPALRSVFQ